MFGKKPKKEVWIDIYQNGKLVGRAKAGGLVKMPIFKNVTYKKGFYEFKVTHEKVPVQKWKVVI
ncbi:MAG: hypothetical protein FWE36_05125 [Erysipelotrichales bacterium]|nr:hypothetical protein [Erysipelotrichales bacterium]